MGEVCTWGALDSHTMALEHVPSPTLAWAGPGLFLQNPDPTNLLLEGDSPSSTSCGQGGSSGRHRAVGVRLCLPMGYGGWRPRPAKMTRRTQISARTPHQCLDTHHTQEEGKRGTTPLSDSAQDIDPRLATEASGREVLQHPFRQEGRGGTATGAAQLCLQNLSLCQSWRILPGWPKWGGRKVGRETQCQSKGAVWFQSELALPLSPAPES